MNGVGNVAEDACECVGIACAMIRAAGRIGDHLQCSFVDGIGKTDGVNGPATCAEAAVSKGVTARFIAAIREDDGEFV